MGPKKGGTRWFRGKCYLAARSLTAEPARCSGRSDLGPCPLISVCLASRYEHGKNAFAGMSLWTGRRPFSQAVGNGIITPVSHYLFPFARDRHLCFWPVSIACSLFLMETEHKSIGLLSRTYLRVCFGTTKTWVKWAFHFQWTRSWTFRICAFFDLCGSALSFSFILPPPPSLFP